MNDAGAIGEIIATYKKHGWLLRRVLLTDSSKNAMDGPTFLALGVAETIDSKIDAAWFSRPPKKGGVAWEIRYLGDVPFALLENLDEDDPEFENALRSVEMRLIESIAAKKAA